MIDQPPELGKGLQNYIEDNDTKDPRTTLDLLDKTMCKIQPFLHGSVLDVGSGNGRLNMIYAKYFDRIVGIDKFREPNPKYKVANYEFKSCDLFHVDGKFNLIMFMGSFYLHYCYGYLDTLVQASKLLEDGGVILVADDKLRNVVGEKSKPGYYDLGDLCGEANLKIVQSLIHEDYLSFSLIGKK